MKIDIRFVTDPEEIASAMALRWAVFVEEQGVSAEDEVDGDDGICHHILARRDDAVVGAARLRCVRETGKIQRVCVPPDDRGQGVGAALIRFVIAKEQQAGRVRLLQLGAQIHAIAFYERLGFRSFGAVYPDAGMPHQDMELRLS